MSGTVQPRFAQMVERVAPDGTDPWVLHWEARQAEAAGQGRHRAQRRAIRISTHHRPWSKRRSAAMRAGDTHYTETLGRPALRAAIAARHAARIGPAGHGRQRHRAGRHAEQPVRRLRCAWPDRGTRSLRSIPCTPPIRPPSGRRAPRWCRWPPRRRVTFTPTSRPSKRPSPRGRGPSSSPRPTIPAA